ncbi:hypothetical protein EZV62_017335 [Acer yangbiense]|uniref:Uncharacterized protein n=1 Tax=Acer yangbiense TaxID=1000413 RepID=A0A5C7HI23_9ROSI|nr:hypothetical protein EZV62_017335 [Acer yangbiense]
MDHVSIDLKELADSSEGEFETLSFLSEDCRIYRVPPKIRMLNETFYTPKMVSIGPLHHGRVELKPMQEHKLRYLEQFLQRTSVKTVDFLKLIDDKETNLQNQLSLFILQDLFMLAKPDLPDTFKEYSLCRFASIFLEYYACRAIPIPLLHNITFMESYFPEAKHFVDLLRLCLESPNRDDTQRYLANSEAAPNIIRLNRSGIKFKTASLDKNLFDIQFISEKKELVIPKLIITNLTVHVLRNLWIFEELHCATNYTNDYGVILHRLLSTPKDVELLSEMGVVIPEIFSKYATSAALTSQMALPTSIALTSHSGPSAFILHWDHHRTLGPHYPLRLTSHSPSGPTQVIQGPSASTLPRDRHMSFRDLRLPFSLGTDTGHLEPLASNLPQDQHRSFMTLGFRSPLGPT